MPNDKANRYGLKEVYLRLWRDWLKPYWRYIAVSFVFMVLVALASAGYSKMIQWIIDAMEARDYSVFYWGPIGVILLALVKGLSQYFRVTRTNIAITNAEADLRRGMYTGLLGADLSSLRGEAPAGMAVRFSSDILQIRQSAEQFFGGISAIMMIIATIIAMLSIDWTMTLIILAVLSCALLPVNIIGARVSKIARKTQDKIAKLSADTSESLQGVRVARTYRLEPYLYKKADENITELQKLKINEVRWTSRISPLMELLAGISVAILLMIVVWRLSRGTTTLGDFLGILTALGILSQPARRLGGTYTALQQGRAALERVFEFLDMPQDESRQGVLSMVTPVKGALKFDNVGYHYPDGFEALKGFSLNIKAGSKVAFVGASGAGKSTVFNLIPRLFTPTSGILSVDDVNVMELEQNDLRDHIALVGQETMLLTGTVAQNIGFGRRDASRTDIIKAAKSASADGFISALPDGYDTHVESAFDGFSGGERQRISIARAILRDAPILLLDEPTSALDAKSEDEIKRALDVLSKSRTTLIIAHRLATIQDADMIVVMDHGKIVETGTHDKLISKKGIYFELFELQRLNG